MNVLILGPQGAGKGTQAKRISVEYEIPHIASGDLYRAEIAADTELGRRVAPLLAAGTLVPDEITIPLVRSMIEREGGRGFILDGYPRNLTQAEALDEMLDEIGRPLSIVLLLELDDDIAVERLLNRAVIEGRPDDTPDAINRRLATYHAETEPIVDRYLATGKLVKLHAERTVEEVWSEIVQAFDQVEARAR